MLVIHLQVLFQSKVLGKELVQNVVFVFKSSFYLGLLPMSSCLKQSLCSYMSNCYNYLHILLEKSSLTNSHSVSLYHWEWSIVDMISHQFSTKVRNIMHGLKVSGLQPFLLKDTSSRTKYTCVQWCCEYMEPWGFKQARQSKIEHIL